MEKIENLSTVIITVLKELSYARQPLTNASLCQALSTKKEFLDLLFQISGQDSNSSSPDGRKPQTKELETQQIRSKAQKTREYEQKLLRQIANLEEANSHIRSFSKKSALTLFVLASENKNPTLSAAIERYRSCILNDAELQVQEECLEEIRNLILKEEPISCPLPAAEQAGAAEPVRAALKETPELSTKTEAPDSVHLYLDQLRNAFSAILSELEAVAPEKYLGRILDLKKRIKLCEDIEALLALGGDLVGLIQTYIDHAGQEREQVATFVAELAKNLSEMENHMLSSFTDTRDSFRENKEFNDSLQVEMESIKESFSIAKTIEESRNYVFSKLAAIKQALEAKRRQDEIRLRTNNEKVGELQKNLQHMRNEISRVQERTKTLEQEVLLDALIGINNRRAYERRLDEEMQRHQRYGQVFSLILFDVDHFKQVNDKYGHHAGDKCLREIINRVKPCLRNSDFLARYGGEEFIIIITGTKKEDACQVAEKIRRIVEKTRFLFQGQEMPVTISLGVTEITSGDTGPEDLFKRVDSAMYKAKNTGRNRVCMA